MSEYRNSVPDNWFVDPVRLGIPGIRRPEDDEGALAWQADALCAQTDPEAFFPEREEVHSRRQEDLLRLRSQS